MKNIVIFFAVLCFLIFGGACFTPELYRGTAFETHNFTEEISSFLITQDEQQLIVIGKQNHYVFAANDTLKFILGWSENQRVKASFYNFVITEKQTVSGRYELSVNTGQDLSDATKKLLISKGFSESIPQKRLFYNGSLEGTRYLANNIKLPETMQFHQKYSIEMSEYQPSTSQTVKRILLTPLALAADGALLLGGIPLLLLAIPLGALN
jgi:hypothetical protein